MKAAKSWKTAKTRTAPSPRLTPQALAKQHAQNPELWRSKRSHSVPSPLITKALATGPISPSLAALAGVRGLAFEFWDHLRTRPDADATIAQVFLDGVDARAAACATSPLPTDRLDFGTIVNILAKEPRWRPAIDLVARTEEKARIRAMAAHPDGVAELLLRARGHNLARALFALLSLANDAHEPTPVRVQCLKALDRVFECVPAYVIDAAPIGLLQQAFPTVQTEQMAEALLARPDALINRAWINAILHTVDHPDDLAARLPSLALKAFAGPEAEQEARALFATFVQPSRAALQSFTFALVYKAPGLQAILTPEIITTCLSVCARQDHRDWLLKELARLTPPG